MSEMRTPVARTAAERSMPTEVAYASIASRSHMWRVAAGVAALSLGCAGMGAFLFGVWQTRQWLMTNTTSQVAMAMIHHSIGFLGRLAIALFGLALLWRSARAWHAAVAYFIVQLIHPLVATVVFPFVASRLWQQASPESYFMLSGYLSGAANGVPPLLVLVLLTRPLVHEMIEQWARGDGVAAGS